MRKVKIDILASEFDNNSFYIVGGGEFGCPMNRGLFRAGLTWVSVRSQDSFREAHSRIKRMFRGQEPIQDFSFELNV